MKLEVVDHQVIAEFESRIEGSFKTDSDSLKEICPVNEAIFYRVTFEEQDIEQIFLCWAVNLKTYTTNESYRLSDTNNQARTEYRVAYWLEKKLNLRESEEWLPVFISPDHQSRSLVAIDGNHRLMAHYLTHGSIDGVQAYLFVHPKAINWSWFPYDARALYFESVK